jgi:dTDP-4-amino-4,6-dideoxygalactose transaminase
MKNSIIPYGKQNITQEDIDVVVEALKSDNLTQGPRIKDFEVKFSEYVGSKYAVAVSNGTAALHLCALALGVKAGEKVITTPITFAASANCIRYCGGDVVFSDIDPETYLLDINGVRKLLDASPRGTYSGIIPVDFAGRAINIEAFRKLADEYGCWIIEDACHSPGGAFIDSNGQTQKCGNGNFADLAIFSFHPVKHIATGEGGMITTNNPELYEKLLILRSHGITRDVETFENFDMSITNLALAKGKESQQPKDSIQWPFWYMEMQTLGYNYRLTDFQAALGISQLSRAEDGLQKRRYIASVYYNSFKDIPGIVDRNIEAFESSLGNWPIVNDNLPENDYKPNKHAYHLYIIEVENRLELYNHLREVNIYAQIHYIPTHLMPYYRQQGWKPGDMPVAETYYERCISLPMYPTLGEEGIQRVIQGISEFVQMSF